MPNNDDDFPPINPGAKMGPLKMARKLLKKNNSDFAKGISKLLKAIEAGNMDDASDEDVARARRAKKILNTYYSTKDEFAVEMNELSLNKDNQAALRRCTDRNFLIAAAARVGSQPNEES